jgi:hypothetical protein
MFVGYKWLQAPFISIPVDAAFPVPPFGEIP